MSSIKVFTPQEVLKGVKSPDFLSVMPKKDAKPVKGTTFFNLRFKNGEKYTEGWFNNGQGDLCEDIILSRGVADPSNTEDKRNEFEGTRMQLETTVSRAGAFGQSVLEMNGLYVKQCEKLQAEGVMNKSIPIKPMLGLTYSDTHPDEAKRGQPVEDPSIRMKIDFAPFPEKYPHKFLVGQPKTQFYDWDTRKIVEENGVSREVFDLATVEVDGKRVPLDANNMHLFITNGSVIKRFRCQMTSVPQAKGQISCPITANQVVLKSGGEERFSDDFIIATTVGESTTMNSNNDVPTGGDTPLTGSAVVDNTPVENVEELKKEIIENL